jgi:hypothetical protein
MKKTLAETPAQEEYEVQLPQSVSLDHTVRIPPEMMPSDEQAMHYFEYFFANVHPYCPVINKATLMLGDVEEGNRWLALATS